MYLSKRFLLMALIFAIILAVNGCDLFNEVDLIDGNDQEELIQELSRADFFNTLITDFGELVQDFIDQTEFMELDPLEVEPLLEGELVFPGVENLDFTAFFAHYDIYLYPGCREILNEEEFKEVLIEYFEGFLLGILSGADIHHNEFNDLEISVVYQYKYFTEMVFPLIRIAETDYPQEELLSFEIITAQTISIDDKSISRARMASLDLAEYPDKFKIYQFYLPQLLYSCTHLLD